MTVAQLIVALSAYDGQSPVYVGGTLLVDPTVASVTLGPMGVRIDPKG